MTALNTLGVTVINPDAVITIEGLTFAEVIAHLGVTVETLRKVGRVLHQENPDSVNEALCEVELAIAALTNTATVMLSEHLRWAKEQGLQFAVAGRADVVVRDQGLHRH